MFSEGANGLRIEKTRVKKETFLFDKKVLIEGYGSEAMVRPNGRPGSTDG